MWRWSSITVLLHDLILSSFNFFTIVKPLSDQLWSISTLCLFRTASVKWLQIILIFLDGVVERDMNEKRKRKKLFITGICSLYNLTPYVFPDATTEEIIWDLILSFIPYYISTFKCIHLKISCY